jgi:hypothetical protein
VTGEGIVGADLFLAPAGGFHADQHQAVAPDAPRAALGLPARPEDRVSCPIDPRVDPRALAQARPLDAAAA